MAYLHGVEVLEVESGTKVIRETLSSVIGLVGTVKYPDGYSGTEMAYNTPVVVRSMREAETVLAGIEASSFTPALRAIFSMGAATVMLSRIDLDPDSDEDPDVLDAEDVRAALDGFLIARTLHGFAPKIFITPGISHQSGIVDEMLAVATQLSGIAIVDISTLSDATSTLGAESEGSETLTPSSVITARTASSGDFNKSSRRVVYTFPRIKEADGTLNWMSSYLAGAMAWKDAQKGYWWSPSNTTVDAVNGLEIAVSFTPGDIVSYANALNGAAVVTMIYMSGGFRIWGNRLSSYPTDSYQSFISGRRVVDIMLESVQIAAHEFNDYPIDQSLIDSIKASVNAFIRTLIGRGALVDGECVYDDADNPSEQIADGHIVFGINYMFPPPAERITFKAFADINLLDFD